jgi:pyridoxal phosphate enzyme (YggS family)
MASSSSASAPFSFDAAKHADLAPELVASIQDNLSSVLQQISASSNPSAVLTPVSKTKPFSYLLPILCHPSTPLSTFGENYAQECIDKMNRVGADLPEHTSFVFIGTLQSNKINSLVQAGANGRLLRIETVSSSKALQKLQSAVADKWTDGRKLEVMLQVDTSREETKSGVDYADVDALKALVKECVECDRLQFAGLMTIGESGDMTAFDKMRDLKAQIDAYVNEELEGKWGEGETGGCRLSMGMSGDFLEAIERGGTNVRCGSNIFGMRDYSNKK